MSTVTIDPLIHHSFRRTPKFCLNHRQPSPSSVNCTRRALSVGAARLSFCNCKHRPRRKALAVRASSTVIETSDVVFEETFDLKRPHRVEGRIAIRFDSGRDEENWKLTIGCNLPGKWVLHWGVHYAGDSGSEWDQPPLEMRPQGSITIKDEETGAWYQHRGMDFKVPLMDFAHDDSNMVGGKKGFGIWTGALGQLSDMLLKSEVDHTKGENGSNGSSEPREKTRCLAGFYEEHVIVKETLVDNSVTVSVKEYPETAKNLLQIDTDLPGDVLIHWGVCRDEGKNWELPTKPYPTETTIFKNKALRTSLQELVQDMRSYARAFNWESHKSGRWYLELATRKG